MKSVSVGVLELGSDLVAETAAGVLGRECAGNDFSRVAVVFPGRRPALFLRRSLAASLGRAFFPPACFSIDDFVSFACAASGGPGRDRVLSDLEGAWFVYRAAAGLGLAGADKQKFSDFLPWASEMFSFFEQLDLEMAEDKALEGVGRSARIGFEVPETINRLLEDAVRLRPEYRRLMAEAGRFTRGGLYRRAAAGPFSGHGFERFIFAGFYYLHRSESALIRGLSGSVPVDFLVQGDPRKWPVLERSVAEVSPGWRPGSPPLPKPVPGPVFLAGFDTHSQAALVRGVLEGIGDRDGLDRTAVVLPEPVSLLPLFSEISRLVPDFNLSLGYPLLRTPWAALFRAVIGAQESRRDGACYARDYLAVLRHPLVKNLRLGAGPAVGRIISHHVEECLLGIGRGTPGGSVFISPREVEEMVDYREVSRTLGRMGVACRPEEAAAVLAEIHAVFFDAWEPSRLGDFESFGAALEKFFDFMVEKSPLAGYPLNRSFGLAALDLIRRISSACFRREKFSLREMFFVFERCLVSETVNFSGTPLRGMQVMGMLETRGLSFREVIVMDAGEGALPRLGSVESLVPAEARTGAGLRRHLEEEEIQRYHFRRLLAGASRAHVVYPGGPGQEPSRFIGELAWEKEKEGRCLLGTAPARATFRLDLPGPPEDPAKSPPVLAHLAAMVYSPSALDEYLACPCRFYYRRVLGLSEMAGIGDEPGAAETGIFLHRFLEKAYRLTVGRKPVLDSDFRSSFLAGLEAEFDRVMKRRLRSGHSLAWRVMLNRMQRFLDLEAERQPGEIIGLERDFAGEITAGGRAYRCACRVDRIERTAAGSLLVIDYKSGRRGNAARVSAPSGGALAGEAGRAGLAGAIGSFQAPFYIDAVEKEFGERASAAFIYLRSVEIEVFPGERNGPREQVLDFCRRGIEAILEEINDPSKPFERDRRQCLFCPFRALCP